MHNLSRDLELIEEIEQQMRIIDLKTAHLIEERRQRLQYSSSDLCTSYQQGLLSPIEVQDIKKESHSQQA